MQDSKQEATIFPDPTRHCTWRGLQTIESVLVGPIEPKRSSCLIYFPLVKMGKKSSEPV